MTRADLSVHSPNLLSSNPSDEDENEPREECGVFGVWAPGEDVAKLTYYGLYALQHRGQEAAGIAVADGSQVLVFKDLGLVSQVFDEQTLAAMPGHVAVGHCRYSTTGSTTWENAQPIFRTTAAGTGIALGHNGNLVNTAELAQRARAAGLVNDKRPGAAPRPTPTSSARLLAHAAADSTIEQAAMELLPTLRARSASPSWTSTRCTRRATRTASARCASDGWTAAGSSPARPPHSTSSARRSSATSSPANCSRSTPTASAPRVSRTPSPRAASSSTCTWPVRTAPSPAVRCTPPASRSAAGSPREHPAEGDLVIPVPESGTPAAVGYAQGSGIPYGQGLMKNAYVGRTFIQPSQTIRQLGIRLKLNPLKEVIRGKRLVVVDDSIVRGNTQRALIRMLREAGALEIHVRIASPPVKWPCFYGIDFASPAELIANGAGGDGDPAASTRCSKGCAAPSAPTPSATSPPKA